MKKLSEIVDFINTGGNYLELGKQYYFCYAMIDLAEQGFISSEDCNMLQVHIRESIGGHAYLATYLALEGLATVGVDYLSDEYKLPAHAHWKALADKLRAEGK